ncbi:MAG: hypothetical protein PHY08_12195 [Candidatus Cloacimonetes bacterium]|nr:hypothetical protein [Candidatus Cloacimonadota bacterium]
MDKIIGQIIKERVKAQKMEVTEFAKLINKERSNAYNIFERSSIDTDLLKKIGQILDYDFFQHLLEHKTINEIVLKNSITNKIYVELNLTDEEIEKMGIKDMIIKKLNE